MASTSGVQANVNLAFPRAGVVFAIRVETPDGNAPTFNLRVTDATGKRTIPFRVDASPQLADWVRGYTRWLRRASVTASYDESGIKGSFSGGLTPEQVLQGVRDACDMIRQRFELYEESVLVA
jgi:hypothetical protein